MYEITLYLGHAQWWPPPRRAAQAVEEVCCATPVSVSPVRRLLLSQTLGDSRQRRSRT
jgi:hypothetical protein